MTSPILWRAWWDPVRGPEALYLPVPGGWLPVRYRVRHTQADRETETEAETETATKTETGW